MGKNSATIFIFGAKYKFNKKNKCYIIFSSVLKVLLLFLYVPDTFIIFLKSQQTVYLLVRLAQASVCLLAKCLDTVDIFKFPPYTII